MFRRKGTTSETPGSGEFSPEEEEAIREGYARVVEEKRRARADPGPPFKTWFLFDGAKWYVGLVFVIFDSWVAAYWLEPPPARWLPLALSVAAALYLEYLAAQYLWHRPNPEAPRRFEAFRPSWRRLTEVGRWTPEWARARAAGGKDPASGPTRSDAEEFL